MTITGGTTMKHWMIAVALVVGCGGGGGSAEPVEPTEPEKSTEPMTETDPTAISNTGLDKPTTHNAGVGDAEPTEKVEPVSADAETEPVADAVARTVADIYMSTGVIECDEPYNKYIDCVMDKMPENGKQAVLDGLAQSADAWKQAASTEEGRKALAESCKAAEGAWEQSAQALGCTW
jgi:hypothetical protein